MANEVNITFDETGTGVGGVGRDVRALPPGLITVTPTSRNAALNTVGCPTPPGREPLEGYPLDTMTMVGSLDRKGKLVALVKVAGLLYQVQPGNYLGQNYGRVTRISETEIVLREIVQDAAGEWTERPATLQLVEGTSK